MGSQITELDGAVAALKTTIAGISDDSLVSDLPTIISDMQRIDTAWTALAAADRPALRLARTLRVGDV